MGCSYSSSEGNVVKHFNIWRARKGAFALCVRVSTTPSRHPHDDVAASRSKVEVATIQQQFHLLRASPL
jgi:hypothetical protein